MAKKFKTIILIAFVLALLLWPIFPSLIITSNQTGKTLWMRNVSSGEKFTIRFTHSVARTDVDEIIRIGKENLIIDSTVYESFGAGLPHDISGEQKMTIENGKVIISNINLRVPEIDLMIGQVVANHRFIYSGKEIYLKELSPEGSSIRFQVVKQNIMQRVGRGLLK